MPRVRKTRAGARAQPKAPAGEEGIDLTLEERKQKLDLFLQDYDAEVQGRITELRKQARAMCDSINRMYMLELMKLPADMKKMKRSDFLRMGGSINSVNQKAADEIVENLANSIECKKSTVKPRRTAKRTNQTVISSIPEEDSSTTDDEPATVRGTRKRAAARGKRGKATLTDTTNMPPPSTARGRRATAKTKDTYYTPFSNMAASRTGWETPMVTPKFDPRLPVTPGQGRTAKVGERIMSMAGSPISNASISGATKPRIQLPVGEGEVINVDADTDLENVEIPELSEQSHGYLAMLQKTIAGIISRVGKR